MPGNQGIATTGGEIRCSAAQQSQLQTTSSSSKPAIFAALLRWSRRALTRPLPREPSELGDQCL